jgi:hypothetical protein
MPELIIVESVVGILLFLHILRPYVRAFWEAAGFAFFPVIALFCCAAMVPAYGIRPECFPLFLFAVVYNVLSFPSVAAVFLRFKHCDTRHDAQLASFIAAALLAFSLVVAFRFTPYDETLSSGAQKTNFTMSDSSRGVDLFVSYYQGEGSDLVLVIPPVTVPLAMIEGTCTVLGDRGYKVLAFSRPSFDNTAIDQNGEAVELPVLKKLNRYVQAASGIRNIQRVREQRVVAAEREADIRFLLSALKTNEALRKTVSGYENVFLLGYGAGGAASIKLAGNKNFLRANPAVKAAAAIESVVLCDFAEEERKSRANILQNIRDTFRRIFQKPIPRLENISHPAIPVLFVAGEGAQQKNSYRRYMAVIQTMLESEAPFLFASINGVHAVDLSSLSQKYPVISFLLRLRGKKDSSWHRNDAILNTADYLAAFFSRVKENPSLAYLQNNLMVPGAVFLETSR